MCCRHLQQPAPASAPDSQDDPSSSHWNLLPPRSPWSNPCASRLGRLPQSSAFKSQAGLEGPSYCWGCGHPLKTHLGPRACLLPSRYHSVMTSLSEKQLSSGRQAETRTGYLRGWQVPWGKVLEGEKRKQGTKGSPWMTSVYSADPSSIEAITEVDHKWNRWHWAEPWLCARHTPHALYTLTPSLLTRFLWRGHYYCSHFTDWKPRPLSHFPKAGQGVHGTEPKPSFSMTPTCH